MDFLHSVATWAIAIAGTCALVLLAGWSVYQVANVVYKVCGYAPILREFALWYRDRMRKERRVKQA